MKDGGPPYNLENPLKGLQSGNPTPTAEPTVSDGGAGSPGSFDDLFTITCGKCKATSPLLKWCDKQIAGYFKCPACGYHFSRRWDWDTNSYKLVEIK